MKHTLSFALCFSILIVFGSPLLAQDTEKPRQALPENMLVTSLDNGLEVVIEEDHSVPIARVHAYMRIGSIFEDEFLGCGLSHYMEHIVSGGSTRRVEIGPDGKEVVLGRTEEENKRLLKSIGNNANASTFYNFTQYYITTKAEMVETAADLISGYLQNCQFDPVEVAREQRVVQQELLRNLDDANRERARLFAETMFKVHPVRIPIIGYRDCIQKVTREDMLRFYKLHYTPQNCVVSVVGDIDKQEALKLVRRHFGNWKRKPLAPYQIPQEPEQTSMRWVEREHGSTKTCLISMGLPTIGLRHPDLYKLDMLSNVLGISASSRLPKKFEHDPQRQNVATGLGTSSWTPSFGSGRLGVYFGAEKVEDARKLVWEIWDEMNLLKEELVTQEEIDRATKVIEKYYYMGRATVEDRAEEYASNQAWLSDPLYNDSYLDKVREITPEDIRQAARTYLVKERLNVVIMMPPQEDAALATAAAEESVGDVKRVELDNGLVLLLKRLPGYGMVDVAAAFNGGVIFEDETNNGLFFLMANTFWRGTESRPFPQLMNELDSLGMTLGAESHNNVYYVQMKALSSDLDSAVDIFSDVLLHPTIEEAWVERLKQILLARVLPNMEVQATQICEKTVRAKLYSKHPYQRQRFGTSETVASFTVDQVRELYRAYTRPNNCVLAIYGDMDVAATEKLIRAKLGSWERGEIPASQVVKDSGPSEPITVELTNDQVRINYRLAWRAHSRQEKKDRWATSVMSSIIGATGWLHARLREGDNDYVYSVYTQPYAGDQAGHYFLDTDFDPSDEKAVTGIIDGVIADVRAGKFTDEELELAKKMILCYSALGKKENETVCQGDALSELFGEGWDNDKEYYAGIKAVTREDVLRVANDVFARPMLKVMIRPQQNVE